LSTLTKTLIVLLTIASIFLCGIVVTYVANADDFREKFNDQRADLSASKEKRKGLKKQLDEQISDSNRRKKKLNSEVASLKKEVSDLRSQLNTIEREKSTLLVKVNNFASIVEDFSHTNQDQGQLLKNTLNELEKVQIEQIKNQKQLKEMTVAIREKSAIIETLEIDKKRLIERKTELQNRLDKLLQPKGIKTTKITPVTTEKTKVKPLDTSTRKIDLKGLVTDVDIKNSVASISIGSADGVTEGMIFHIVRSNDFIRDILIIDVDTEQAVGVFQLGELMPKIGDSAITNF